MKQNKKIRFLLLAVVLAAAAAGVFFVVKNGEEQTADYPVHAFTNMCTYEGQVYCGINGIYGEPIAQESSIFTIQNGKIYYVDKVQENYQSMTDELLSIWCADMDGENAVILAEDVFLAGIGHEKLIGNKLFYGYAYDENWRMKYASYDLDTGKRKEIKSDRIDSILGYDGNYLYYNGYDSKKEQNILGRIYLKTGRDQVLTVYEGTDELGYIDSVLFDKGKLYCFTLTKKPEGYDYREYEYRMQIRDGESGEITSELPMAFTGSANYSFLIENGKLYSALQEGAVEIALDGNNELRVITQRAQGAYWGILHFISEDGYLYYEEIADTDEKTGNNDYFYRVPLKGGNGELLKAWFMQ